MFWNTKFIFTVWLWWQFLGTVMKLQQQWIELERGNTVCDGGWFKLLKLSFLKELAYRKEMVRADLINKKVGIRYALKTSLIYLLLERIQEWSAHKTI